MKNIKYQIYRFLCNITWGEVKQFCITQKSRFNENKINIPALPDFMDYEKCRQSGNGIRNNLSFDPNLTALIGCHTLNKIKELDLKRKIREGKKVKVGFLIDQPGRNPFISVYNSMLNNSLFEPVYLVYDHFDGKYETIPLVWTEYLKNYENMKSKGWNVEKGYDKNKNFIPIENFKPDILFTNGAYFDPEDTYLTNIYNNINFLVCYINYSLNTVNNYNYHYNNRRLASCWKFFVESREDYKEHLKYSRYCGTNTVLSGYPKLDTYAKPISECKIPKKIDNEKPIIIYAPHWTIKFDFEPHNLGTFHIYNKYFLELAKKHPEFNFVFKPHPDLMISVVNKNIMTQQEYLDYIQEWENLPNTLYLMDGDYIDLFRKSDLLIQDSGSFIGEWLPTDKPCIYLVNPERNQKTYMDGFSIVGKKILEKYYLAHNKEEIDNYFKMIMFDKQDPIKEERIKLKDELFINIGSAGQKIVDYLTDILTGEKL